MNRDKQIEEMLNEICVNCNYLLVCEDEHLKQVCRYVKVVKVLYDAGYRKQSEGEWMRYPHNSGIYCSLCKRRRRYRDINDAFCPNCGAKMKGGEQG